MNNKLTKRQTILQDLVGPGEHQGGHESAMCPCGKGGKWYPGLPWDKHCPQVEAHDPSPLLCPGEATSGVLGPLLGSSVPRRHGHTGDNLLKGHSNEGQEDLFYEERLRDTVQAGEHSWGGHLLMSVNT